MEQKEAPEKQDFIKWFPEVGKNSGDIVGAKGANLGEIYDLGIQVPQGFVVTSHAYQYFIEKAGTNEKIKELLERIDFENTQKLDEITRQIRTFILDSKIPEKLSEEIIESYELLDVKEENIQGAALDILKSSSEPVFVAVRTSPITNKTEKASFAGQQDTYLNIKGKEELIQHVKKCFASLFTSRAIYYKKKKGIPIDEFSTAVIIQKMIDSDKSGVIFTKDPVKKNENMIIEAVWGLGEGIVSGMITPDSYEISKDLEILDKKISDKKIAITRKASGERNEVRLNPEESKYQVLKEHEIMKISDIGQKLEEHYKNPQNIEFAIVDGEIYIVQTRAITTLPETQDTEEELQGEILLQGIPASQGKAVGKTKIIRDVSELNKINHDNIIVTDIINPDIMVSMQKSAGIITKEGGISSNIAIVSREMEVPCVVGTQNTKEKLEDEQIITLDSSNGKVYRGKISETYNKEIKPITTNTKTKLNVIVDLPNFSERAAKTGIKRIGLTRIEGIIAESGKHPNYFKEKGLFNEYENTIYKGLEKISNYFEEIWVRTSDIKSDEYRELEGTPEEKETNPLLGMHGIRYSLKNPEIFKAELKALKRVSEKIKTGIILPQIINLEELQEAKNLIKEIEAENLKIGIIIETPASIQLIKNFCDEGIDFISFGIDNLTQHMLALDKENTEIQNLYNEMHPAILYQLAYVIRVCKRYGVETSIYGNATSKKSMIDYLIEKGIDSISINPDIASEISEYIKEKEEQLVKGTDKEPRLYEQKKEEEIMNQKENNHKENKPDNEEHEYKEHGHHEHHGGEKDGNIEKHHGEHEHHEHNNHGEEEDSEKEHEHHGNIEENHGEEEHGNIEEHNHEEKDEHQEHGHHENIEENHGEEEDGNIEEHNHGEEDEHQEHGHHENIEEHHGEEEHGEEEDEHQEHGHHENIEEHHGEEEHGEEEHGDKKKDYLDIF